MTATGGRGWGLGLTIPETVSEVMGRGGRRAVPEWGGRPAAPTSCWGGALGGSGLLGWLAAEGLLSSAR